MSSSTFEVRESESDSEKVLDFELDSCEENGIMSTSVEGELPKDHTYTKEPDVLEDSGEIFDSGSAGNEEDVPSSPEKSSRPSRSSRSKAPAKKSPVKVKAKKAPAKKAAPAKREPVSRKGKSKEEKHTEEPKAEKTEEVTPNGNVGEPSDVAEESPKPAVKRGRKRKAEEKEEDSEQNAEESAVEEPVKTSPAKMRASVAKAPKAAESHKKKGNVEEVTDNQNLPLGWVRKSVTRQSGKTAGMIDVYFYSPDGVKFRSKPEIATYLMKTKSNLKLELFDFSKKGSSTDSPVTPKKKAASAKPKKVPAKKSPPTQKNSALLVKIVSGKNKKGSTKKSPAKSVSKTASKGKKGAKSPAKKSKK